MNIVTFATPVSAKTLPRMWAVSLYYDTVTGDSFRRNGWGVMQLLTPSQSELVEVLGKHSGYDEPEYDKKRECAKLGYTWVESGEVDIGIELLPKCASYVALKVVSSGMPSELVAGDHVVVLCEIVQISTWNDAKKCVKAVPASDAKPVPMDADEVLYTGQLRREGII